MKKSIAASLVFLLLAASCGSGSTSSSSESDETSETTEEDSGNETESNDDKDKNENLRFVADEESDDDEEEKGAEKDDDKEIKKSSAEDESKLVQTLVAEFSDSGDFDEIAGDGDEAVTCLAKGIVDEFGADRLEELGVTEDSVSNNPDFTSDEEAQMLELTFSCLDVKELLGTVGGLPEELADCVVDEVGEDEIREIMSAAANGEENVAMEATIEEASTKCATE